MFLPNAIRFQLDFRRIRIRSNAPIDVEGRMIRHAFRTMGATFIIRRTSNRVFVHRRTLVEGQVMNHSLNARVVTDGTPTRLVEVSFRTFRLTITSIRALY